MASHETAYGKPGEPIAEKTLLGWSCAGPIPGFMVRTKYSHFVNNFVSSKIDSKELAELSRLVQRQWDVDALGMTEKKPLLSAKMTKTCSKPHPDTWSDHDKEVDKRMKVFYDESPNPTWPPFHGKKADPIWPLTFPT